MEMPMLASIRETPKYIPGISEKYLRQLEAKGKLPGPYSGKKKLVNLPMLLDWLNEESAKCGREDSEQ